MRTGANKVFRHKLMANAVSSFSVPNGPASARAAQSMPIRDMASGTPAEKIMNASVMHIPRTPHASARGTRPKRGGR